MRIDTCGSLPIHYDAETGSREVHATNLDELSGKIPALPDFATYYPLRSSYCLCHSGLAP